MRTKLFTCCIVALSAMFLAGCSSEQKTETPVTESVLLYYGSLMTDAAGTGYEAESSAALYGLPKEIYPVKPFDGMSGKVKGVIVRTEDQYGETDPDIIVYGENGYKTKAEYIDKYDRYEYEFSMKWTGDNKLVEESKLLHEDAEGGYDAVYTIDGILDRSSKTKDRSEGVYIGIRNMRRMNQEQNIWCLPRSRNCIPKRTGNMMPMEIS